MATNPMQRKARNSFLLGMLLMLIITGAIIAFLILQLTNMKREEQEEQASYVAVYTLNRNVESGEEVTEEDFTQTEVVRDNAPTDYLTPSDLPEGEAGSMIAKITMTRGTVLSKEMLYIDETVVGNDVRKQERDRHVDQKRQRQNGQRIEDRPRVFQRGRRAQPRKRREHAFIVVKPVKPAARVLKRTDDHGNIHTDRKNTKMYDRPEQYQIYKQGIADLCPHKFF